MGENNTNRNPLSLPLIIVDRGPGSIGKTTSIRNVFNKLQAKYPTTTTVYKPAGAMTSSITSGDVKATIQIGSTLVGIESQGDPGSRMQDSLADFISCGCEIILIACRNQGDTINTITTLESKGHTVLWLQNGKCPNNPACWDKLTAIYGEWIADIIERCALSGMLHPVFL